MSTSRVLRNFMCSDEDNPPALNDLVDFVKPLSRARQKGLLCVRNKKGETPLHMAVEYAEINRWQRSMRDLRTVIHITVQEIQRLEELPQEAVGRLLDAKRQKLQGLRADHEILRRCPENLQFIIRSLASTKHPLPAAALQDKAGNTPLHLAAEGLHPRLVGVLARAFPFLVSCPNEKGNTPLARAFLRGRLQNMRELLACGADINALNPEGQTLLHRALIGGRWEKARGLVALGADIDVRNARGASPAAILRAEGRGVLRELFHLHAHIEGFLLDHSAVSSQRTLAQKIHKDVADLYQELRQSLAQLNAREAEATAPEIAAEVRRNIFLDRIAWSAAALERSQMIGAAVEQLPLASPPSPEMVEVGHGDELPSFVGRVRFDPSAGLPHPRDPSPSPSPSEGRPRT